MNPPYDVVCSDGHNERTERLFLEHCFRWLQPGGVLVMAIPAQRVGTCSQILAAHFREISIYRLTALDSERYQQTAVFGIRRTRQEKDRLKDSKVSREKGRLWELTIASTAVLSAWLPSTGKSLYLRGRNPALLRFTGGPSCDSVRMCCRWLDVTNESFVLRCNAYLLSEAICVPRFSTCREAFND